MLFVFLKQATAMSEVSCMEDSPFPKHPGITKCCEEQSLERKLCLANLRVLSEEFPSLEEPTDDEICKQFTADPKGYMESLAVRFGQMIPSASFEEVLPVADYLQQGLAKCCFNPNPECLIKEFIGLKTVLCMNSTLPAKYDKLEKCCTKPCLDVLPCVDSLDGQPPTQLAEIQEPDNEDLCKDASSVTIKNLHSSSEQSSDISIVSMSLLIAHQLALTAHGARLSVFNGYYISHSLPQNTLKMDRGRHKTAKQCLELLHIFPNNDSDAAETDNDESGSEADWACEDESSSSSDSEEDASEVPGPSV
ncbi:UNVERIFIED_CONTAM: hypothetical protein FKN15_042175 [Acipenser sinensis]